MKLLTRLSGMLLLVWIPFFETAQAQIAPVYPLSSSDTCTASREGGSYIPIGGGTSGPKGGGPNGPTSIPFLIDSESSDICEGDNQVLSANYIPWIFQWFSNTLSQRTTGGIPGRGPRTTQNGTIYETEIGLNTGDGMIMLGAWGGYAYTSFDNDFSRTKYDGHRHAFIGGVDFSPRENLLMGISFGYEDTSVDVDFNNGDADTDGWTIAPYFGVVLDDVWSVDVSFGYSELDTDQDRAGGLVTSDFDTERWFAAANLTGFTQMDNWLLTGRVGAMHSITEDNAYTESNGTFIDTYTNRLTQIIVGGEAAYPMGVFEPFIGATYSYDLMSDKLVLTPGKQPEYDRSDVILNAGFRYYSKGGPSVTLDVNKRYGRAEFDEASLNLNLNWNF